MKKIYWCVQQINRIGGAEMVSIDLANSLAEYYDITVLSTVKIEGDIPFYVSPKVKVDTLGLPKRTERVDVLTKKYLKHFRIISLLALYLQVFYHYVIKKPIYKKRLQNLLLKDDALLICSSVDSYMLAPRKGRVFFHFHLASNVFFRADNYPIFKISRKPNKFIFTSKATMDDVVARLPKLKEKSDYVLNPVRFDRVHDLTFHHNTIIFAGRFNTIKNPMLALAVAKELKERNFKYTLNMFGDPVMIDEMNKYIKDNELSDNVHLYPPTTNIRQEILNSDLLLLTSQFESFALVLVEAEALSRPWVSSCWGSGVDDIYQDGVDGTIVRTQDPKDYADAIMKYFESNESLIEAKERSYKASVKFSKEAIIPKWRELIG